MLTSPAGVQREPSDFAVDLRVQPEPVFLVCVHPKLVFRVNDQYTETASQDVNERSHGLAPGSSDVASFSSSSLPVPGEAFVELRPSASGPTLVRFRYIDFGSDCQLVLGYLARAPEAADKCP